MMKSFKPTLLTAAILAAVPALALAQTSSPGSANSPAGSGYTTGPTYSGQAQPNPAVNPQSRSSTTASSANPHNPGATGNATVPGNNSSIASDRTGTVTEKSGVTQGHGGGTSSK